MDQELSPEVLARIEEKRLNALKLRSLKLKQKEENVSLVSQSERSDVQDNSVDESHETKEDICDSCGMTGLDKFYLESYGEKVCKHCAHTLDIYSQLTKSDVASKYLLSDFTINSLPFAEKRNPHHRSWTAMKLYLRKHAQAAAHKKWGSEEALQNELRKREEMKLKRKLKTAETFFQDCKSGKEGNEPMPSKKKIRRQRLQVAVDEIVSAIKGD